jgi:hypothetical protein
MGSQEAKPFRQKLLDVSLFRALRALEKYDCIRPKFVNHLTAGAARRARHSLIIGYRDGVNLHSRAQLCDS